MYNSKYYFDGALHQLRPKDTAIHTFQLSDGTLVAMFKGNRGQRPDVDFKIKLLRVGEEETPETPPHLYWVADLIIKCQHFPKEIREIIEYFISYYDRCKPFDTVEERASYKPETVEYILNNYGHVRVDKTLPIDYIAYIIELFCLCEKRNDGAFMFRDLLHKVRSYIDGELDYMHLLSGFK